MLYILKQNTNQIRKILERFKLVTSVNDNGKSP